MTSVQPVQPRTPGRAAPRVKNRVGGFSGFLEIRIDGIGGQPAQLHRVTWTETVRPVSGYTKGADTDAQARANGDSESKTQAEGKTKTVPYLFVTFYEYNFRTSPASLVISTPSALVNLALNALGLADFNIGTPVAGPVTLYTEVPSDYQVIAETVSRSVDDVHFASDNQGGGNEPSVVYGFDVEFHETVELEWGAP